MGHQPESQSGSPKRTTQAAQSDPQNQNRNDNNVTDSNKPDNRSAQQNKGARRDQQH